MAIKRDAHVITIAITMLSACVIPPSTRYMG
jgi:hypothetical protein